MSIQNVTWCCSCGICISLNGRGSITHIGAGTYSLRWQPGTNLIDGLLVMCSLADTWRRSGLAGDAPLLFVEYAGAHQRIYHSVRVAVRGRSTVLQVALLLLGHSPRYPDAAATVSDT